MEKKHIQVLMFLWKFKNTMSNLPIFLILFPISTNVVLEDLQCQFSWEDLNDHRHYHLVA